MVGILDALKRGGATILDVVTPDALFGNVGKVGHRRVPQANIQGLMDNRWNLDMPQASSPPIAPQQQTRPQSSSFRNGLGILDRVLGGQTITEAQEAQRQVQAKRAMEPQQAAERQRLYGMLDSLNLSPEERYLAETQPEAWAKIAQDRLNPRVVSDSVYSNGQFVQAPERQKAPEPPRVVETPYGLVEYDPVTRTTRKLESWQAPSIVAKGITAPSRGGGSRASKGTNQEPPG